MAIGDEPQNNGKYADSEEYALWDKYESVAMHFNELIIRLRTQALGGLTGIVAISGLALNFTQKPESQAQWEILFGTLVFFLLAWVALWILDMGYYNKLLKGAVDAIVAHENRTPAIPGAQDRRINLSSKIAARVPRYNCVVFTFYFLVSIGLALGIAYVLVKAITWEAQPSKSIEYKLQLSYPDKLNVTIENVKPAAK